jgi:hypothetical protein
MRVPLYGRQFALGISHANDVNGYEINRLAGH